VVKYLLFAVFSFLVKAVFGFCLFGQTFFEVLGRVATIDWLWR